ncbi:MAG: D-alanyl-D-alanine carboxypeptidase/D-alanyl-D-alanine-endopeptidase [Muribaculaceae bacterium]|nr:D-alanyl-D-alanine carboxypeptidase/D-alanyl-D-alanine-endopeptidase [Muribaculaceae bacterium]
MIKRRTLLSTLLALIATLPLMAYTAQEAVDLFVSHSSLRYAAVGVTVVDLDSAKAIAGFRQDQANITASTMKTVVSSAALGLMGPHFLFETPVYLDGEVVDACFKGNIVIRGLGDPTLGSVYLPNQANIVDEIIAALQARGITRVEGMVIADDTYYGYPYYHNEWEVEDLAYDYGTAVHALNFHDNLMTVSFTLDSRGRLTQSSIKPSVPGVKVISRCRSHRNRNNVTPYLDYSVPALVLTGNSSSTKSYRDTYANPTPAPMLVDSVERALLRSSEIRYDYYATARDEVSQAERSLLVLHKSPELTEIITSLLDRSDNMFAHALLRAIGAREWELKGQENMPSDLDAIGVEAVKHWLELQGVNTEPLFMRDGSGLARANKASVNFFGDMLTMMAHRSFDGVRLCDLMPTASDRVGETLKNNPLSERIVLKSGSMRHVQCFVGYYPADNPHYAFAVLVNNFTCSRASIKDQIGTFLCNLFEGK